MALLHLRMPLGFFIKKNDKNGQKLFLNRSRFHDRLCARQNPI